MGNPGDPPRAGRPPGLFDTDEELKHEVDGLLCGGSPNSKLIGKLISHFDVKFKMADTIFEYLEKKRVLMSQFRCVMPSKTVYTLISLFTTKARELRKVWQKLLDKKAHFTSFEHFLREVEASRYPDLAQAAYVAFCDCRQKHGESVREYWLQWEDYASLIEVDAADHAVKFIDGIWSEEIRRALRVKWSETKDFSKLVELADTLEQGDDMERRRKSGYGKGGTVASVSRGGGNGRSVWRSNRGARGSNNYNGGSHNSNRGGYNNNNSGYNQGRGQGGHRGKGGYRDRGSYRGGQGSGQNSIQQARQAQQSYQLSIQGQQLSKDGGNESYDSWQHWNKLVASNYPAAAQSSSDTTHVKTNATE